METVPRKSQQACPLLRYPAGAKKKTSPGPPHHWKGDNYSIRLRVDQHENSDRPLLQSPASIGNDRDHRETMSRAYMSLAIISRFQGNIWQYARGMKLELSL